METTDTIHRAWRAKRDAALADFFAEFASVEDWSSIAIRPGPDGAADNRLWISFATMAAAYVDAHDAAYVGYFNLGTLTAVGNDISAAGRLYYSRSLHHAQLAENHFGISSAAYCLGCIEASEGAPDAARAHFLTARDHADKAGSVDGKSAALFRLALLAMAESDMKVSFDYAIESYTLSRDAGRFGPAVETLTRLFEFWRSWSADDLALNLAVDVLSRIVHAFSTGGDADSLRSAAAHALRAIAPLHPTVRENIFEKLSDTIGRELSDHFRNELQTIIATLDAPEKP